MLWIYRVYQLALGKVLLWGQMVQQGCLVLWGGISVHFNFLLRADRITCVVFSEAVLLMM